MLMSHLKCAFGISSGKFFGFTVHRKRVTSILQLRLFETRNPHDLRIVKSFTGRLSYVHKFIPPLVKLLKPFHHLLKKNASLRSMTGE